MQARTRLALFPALVLTASLQGQKDPGTSYRLRVVDPVTPTLRRQLEAGFDVLPQQEGGLDVIVMPLELSAFRRLGIRTKLVGRGRPFAAIAQSGPEGQPDTRYYTPAEILTKIDSFVTKYPQLAKRIDLTTLPGAGKTHENRGIYALKVSDNVAIDEDEPAILVASEHHARELNTPVMVFGAIDRILKDYSTNTTLKSLVDGHELFFVPCVNPDGTNYVWTKDNWWRKNRRFNGGTSYGVDNNRNYPFLFGRCGASSNSNSQIYKGPSAGSEPENRTMMAFSRIYKPEIYLDFHSSGREVLFTYAPCATVNTTIRGLLDRYKNSLRSPMRYATRAPSASGEAPEFFWSGGAISFLTEVMTSFQPSYSSAVLEAARVWPGVLAALTTWRPAVRGHVTSIFKNQPVEATITYTPNLFFHGEQNGSRARDGRYAVWLPLGTYTLRYAAPGFQTATVKVVVTSYDSPQTVDVRMIPTMPPATITKSGTDRIGSTTSLTYTSKGDVGENYWVLLSGGTNPGIPVGAGRVVPLNADAVLFASIPVNGLLTNHTGKMPASGQAVAGFPIPAIPALIGITVYAAGVTENANYLTAVKNFSPAVAIKIKP